MLMRDHGLERVLQALLFKIACEYSIHTTGITLTKPGWIINIIN
jgi:hypothetical protein